MSDYIKREDAITAIAGLLNVIEQVDGADVVEVVRCKDCIFRYKYKDLEQCKRNPNWESWDAPIVTETDYCSYGERKSDEVDS